MLHSANKSAAANDLTAAGAATNAQNNPRREAYLTTASPPDQSLFYNPSHPTALDDQDYETENEFYGNNDERV